MYIRRQIKNNFRFVTGDVYLHGIIFIAANNFISGKQMPMK